MDSRLHAASGIAKTGTEANAEIFQTLNRRGHSEAPPPPVWQYLQVVKQRKGIGIDIDMWIDNSGDNHSEAFQENAKIEGVAD
jgi:hypothetical protein